MYLYNLLKEEWKQCPGLQPTAPPGPGGIHTAHASQLLVGCLSYLLLFNLTGVDNSSQRTKRMCRIIMAMKKLRILNHTSVWWLKNTPFILVHAFILRYNNNNNILLKPMQEGTYKARVIIWIIVRASVALGTRMGEGKDTLWNESPLGFMLVFPVNYFVQTLLYSLLKL